MRGKRDKLVGRVLGGQYRVDTKIGEGGMGTVYRGTQLAIDRAVAIKVLQPRVSAAQRAHVENRFKREALATSRLNHPNTVRVIDSGQAEDGVLYLVLELLEGGTLTQVVTQEGPLSPQRVARLGKQIAKSLSEAHSLGIVHRDLKPDNIFVCDFHGEPDFVKVMDFGIARLVHGDKGVDMTRAGVMVGTPRYIAPEQAMARPAGPAADLYALGVMLYEMLSGQAPFEADSALALALMHINEPLPSLNLPDFPAALADDWQGLVESLLAKDPTDRPQHASEVALWLEQIEDDSKRIFGRPTTGMRIPAQKAPTTYEGPSPHRTITVDPNMPVGRASRVLLGVAAVALMVAGGVMTYLLMQPEERPSARIPNAPTVVASPRVRAAVPEPPRGPVGSPVASDKPTLAVAEPGLTRLLLDSDPVGVVVRDEGVLLCTTPCDLNFSGGRSEIRVLTLSLPGYHDEKISVPLTPGETAQRWVGLASKPPTP
ncbi:MAG: tRNA A-37 threonylcarbamoyl transferase component Bud32 [Myxococcota bacterium]